MKGINAIRHTLIAVAALLWASTAIAAPISCDSAQWRPRLLWSVDLNAVLNNREGGDEMRPDQTFFFTRLTPQIGIGLGPHSARAGVVWYQPLVNELSGYKVVPLVYYHYSGAVAEAKVGMFEAMESMPRYLRSDSINYLQPVMRGAYVGYRGGQNRLRAWLDWRQMQSATRREAFAAGAEYRRLISTGNSTLGAGAIVEYSHLAKRSKAAADRELDGVNDHVIINPSITWRGGAFGVELGLLLSLDRDRHASEKWRTPAGVVANADWHWRWLGVEQTFYAGKEQMPLYGDYGSELYWGDTWYHNKFYSRTDVSATVFSTSYLNLEARLTFHASNHTTAFWQQVTARFYFDQTLWHSSNRKSLPKLAPRF